MHRAHVLCDRKEDLLEELALLKNGFVSNGCPEKLVLKTVQESLAKDTEGCLFLTSLSQKCWPVSPHIELCMYHTGSSKQHLCFHPSLSYVLACTSMNIAFLLSWGQLQCWVFWAFAEDPLKILFKTYGTCNTSQNSFLFSTSTSCSIPTKWP